MNWPEIYHTFAEKFGWTPDVVNDLTHYQIRMYLSEFKTLKELNKEQVKPQPHQWLSLQKWHNDMTRKLQAIKDMLTRAVKGGK